MVVEESFHVDRHRATLRNPEGAEQLAEALGRLGCFGSQARAAVPEIVEVATNLQLTPFWGRALVSLSKIAPESQAFRDLTLSLLLTDPPPGQLPPVSSIACSRVFGIVRRGKLEKFWRERASRQ